MVDAAGTIYVIGGEGINGILFTDVWVSTDGGARPDSRRDAREGYWVGTQGVLQWSRDVPGGSQGTPEGRHGGCREVPLRVLEG
jgi:hypothetical protein